MATTPNTMDGALEALSAAQAKIRELEDGTLFTSSLRLLERGVLDRQLGEELQELVEKVTTQQKQGSITVKLVVKPDSDEDSRMKIAADFTTKAPKLPRKDSILFLERDGSLTRNYPGQTTSPALGGEEV
ncbi:unannotated protein [freshwater metagenome]|uniref:Unannotated protein n=1 Tax=freshwater metagenome TaxID=449393 RepID=A0A6J7FX07_9ZZZZ|nr:hypothetical protein [Actinomycetota bacterium]